MTAPLSGDWPIDYFSIHDGDHWWPIPFKHFKHLCEINGTDLEAAIASIDRKGSVKFLGMVFKHCKRSFNFILSNSESRVAFAVFDVPDVADAADDVLSKLQEAG